LPELPEVETIAAALRGPLPGRRITDIKTRCLQLRRPLPLAELAKLVNETILAVERRAKYLLLTISNGHVLLLHLGMTGTLRLDPPTALPGRHDHLDLELDRNLILRFRDPRKFGLVAVVKPNPDGGVQELAALAPEPLSADFSTAYFYELSRKRNTPVKNFIMDQHRVVGVGNIYASECLFRAQILPSTPVGRLSRERCHDLVNRIKEVLSEAIASGGTTISDFHAVDGSEGAFVRKLEVYGRNGEACLKCQKPIERTVIGGRATFFCPRCQKA